MRHLETIKKIITLILFSFHHFFQGQLQIKAGQLTNTQRNGIETLNGIFNEKSRPANPILTGNVKFNCNAQVGGFSFM